MGIKLAKGEDDLRGKGLSPSTLFLLHCVLLFMGALQQKKMLDLYTTQLHLSAVCQEISFGEEC